MEDMLGIVKLFAGNFAPRGWAICDGQLLPIAQNTALFSILGTTYGGDGRTTFGLPDLRGRAAIGEGNGPGLSDRRLGSKGGQEDVTLTTSEMPSHNHSISGASVGLSGSVTAEMNVNNGASDGADPNSAYLGQNDSGSNYANAKDASSKLAPDAITVDASGLSASLTGGTIGNNGGGQSHNNMQPFVTMNWIICMQGTFPSRS